MQMLHWDEASWIQPGWWCVCGNKRALERESFIPSVQRCSAIRRYRGEAGPHSLGSGWQWYWDVHYMAIDGVPSVRWIACRRAMKLGWGDVSLSLYFQNDIQATSLCKQQPGVGFVVRVAAWDPRVLSSSPVGR